MRLPTRLADAFWPGPLTLVVPKADGLSGRRARDRRARHDRAARAGPSGRARDPCGVRQASGRAVCQPLRSCVADDSAARAGRSRRTRRPHHRRRAGAAGRGIRPSSPAWASRCCCGPAPCRAKRSSGCWVSRWRRRRRDDRGRRPRRRSRRGNWRRTTRRAPGCDSTRRRCMPAKRLLAFGPSLHDAPHAAHASIFRRSGDLLEAAANLFSYLRALDAAGASAIAVMPIPREGPGRSHQRPLAPRRRAARACASLAWALFQTSLTRSD